ncbi:GTPase family protein [Capilliphycus salinus ALCB114379]|uniref:GTPase family protein n=1 Tax=Capilliphycus salinus TaxID=2768948 RepID=UPI0039A74C81
MVRLKPWQWVLLALPVAAVVIFIMVTAGYQINQWGINWIWGIVTLVFVGWRWLLVRWTKPAIAQVEAVMAEVNKDLEASLDNAETPLTGDAATQNIETKLQEIIQQTRNDAPVWEDWGTFWKRCQDVVITVANTYYPEVKYPLLNIYIPQAYGLIRGTVDDMDRWMQQLSPVLNQVTVGKAFQAYEMYQKLEPSARKLWQVWNWALWVINPAAAAAKVASKRYSDQANQQLLVNLSQMLREAALRNLCRQAITLYSGTQLPASVFSTQETPTLPKAKTATLREIFEQAEPTEKVEQKPINILLAGRTGAGKSSLINTLFQAEKAEVDVLPSTDKIKNYQWETPTGETLILWDTPGYEQINRSDFRDLVLDFLGKTDLLLLVTPALDPALQMDVDFLQDMKAEVEDLRAIAIVTQVDRLRPVREWEPAYNWQAGNRPKEVAIREATEYRSERLGEICNSVLPVVTGEINGSRKQWGIDALSIALVELIPPTKQLRLARFLRNLDARTVAAAKIIDRYTFQMTTTQGLTALLKSPILKYIATISTGSPALAYLLAEQIPVEQLPVVIGKLQMGYDLFSVLNPGESNNRRNFDLLTLWPLLLENPGSPEQNAWAFGHGLVEYWTKDLTIEQLRERFEYYFQQVKSQG